MTNCPICNSKVSETAKFCVECGAKLTTAASERAWIVTMQEKIRLARNNNSLYNMVAIVGILLAAIVPFLMHYVFLFTMDSLSWSLTFAGILLFIGSAVCIGFDNKKVKELIEELQKGQKEDK